MKESVTEALVLGVTPSGETDSLVSLYTKEFGRIEARAIGGKKALSKFAPHLDVMNHVLVRLVKKNTTPITDALLENRFLILRNDINTYGKAFVILRILKNCTPLEAQDFELWHLLIRSFSASKPKLEEIMRALGYTMTHAKCDVCKSEKIAFFETQSQVFLCESCGGKFERDDVVYIA